MKLYKNISLIIIISFLFSCATNTNKNVFDNEFVGFKIEKLESWHFVTNEQYIASLKRVKFNDKNFQELILQNSAVPLVVIAKYKEPYPKLNPAIKITVKPSNEIINSDPLNAIGKVLDFMKSNVAFKNVKVIQKPMMKNIGEEKAYYFSINYDIESKAHEIFHVYSQLWLVPHGDYFFLIGASLELNSKDNSQKEIDEIIQTIIIKKRQH